MKNKKIAVLSGGISCEREISLISGRAVSEALAGIGMQVVNVDPRNPHWLRQLKKERVAIAFNALHGSFGEDGGIQKILEKAGILYTGSGVAASEWAFDKSKSQALFRKKKIQVPDYLILRSPRMISKLKPIIFPVVVKPAKAGSSVGVSLVRDAARLPGACREAFRFSDKVLIEQYILGRELTVGILGGKPLPIVEVVVKRTFYDYEAKYGNAQTSYKFPAKLTADEAKRVSRAALRAYRALGCRVMARADIILSREGVPYVLEVNTIPGLTGKSLLPKAALASGIDFQALCVRILGLSLVKTGQNKRGILRG